MRAASDLAIVTGGPVSVPTLDFTPQLSNVEEGAKCRECFENAVL